MCLKQVNLGVSCLQHKVLGEAPQECKTWVATTAWAQPVSQIT